MNKVIIPIILLTFAVAIPVYSQNIQVKIVSEDSKEAVLQDRDTGREWVAKSGDEVAGWKIVKIRQDKVTIMKQGEGHVTYKTDLPVKGKSRFLELTPEHY
jgi:hypothetical protein